MAAVRSVLQNVILLLFTGIFIRGNVIDSCNTTTHLTFGSSQTLFIANLHVWGSNTTTINNITRTFVENCNARHQCSIPRITDQCVQGVYGYVRDSPTLEICSNSTVNITGYSYYLQIMSTNYKNGSDQQAENVHCNYKVTDPGIDLGDISISILEFAPFASSRDFCLNFEGYTDPIMCSGSEFLFKWKTIPNKSRNQKEVQFSLTLPKTATIVPLVRYWISFVVSPFGDKNHQLKCTSKPVDFQVTERSEVFTTDAPISATVSLAILILGIALCLIAALTISWTCVKYRSLKKRNKMAARQLLEAACNQIPMVNTVEYLVTAQTPRQQKPLPGMPADTPEIGEYTEIA